MALVEYTKSSEHVGVITLNDPDKLNAMSEDMAVEFKKLISEIDTKGLRALILTGAGRAFSAGGDLKMLQKKPEIEQEENKRIMLEYYNSFLCIRDLGVPLIAAINGHAIGAGLCLASGCDIRVCSQDAKLGVTFVKLGLHPGMGATYFFPRIIGISAAAELLSTGRVIKADEALSLGLVSHLVPADKVVEKAQSIASEIVSSGPLAVKLLTETLRKDIVSLKSSLENEAEAQKYNYASDEFKEGVQAIIEKRSPNF